MAMSGSQLFSEVRSAIEGVTGATMEDATSQALWLAICNAIIAHIQSNAEVATSVTVTSVSGVTSGTSTSGPGTGSGSGTIL
jgi:hypothetical protein